MKFLVLSLLQLFFVLNLAQAGTPPSATSQAYLHDAAGNPINSTGTSLNVAVTNAIAASISSSLGAPVFTQTVFGGLVVDPRGRNWNLGFSTDFVSSVQSGSWNVGVNNFPATQAVTQSGSWTTGRTWSLLNTTDSVNSVQSGSWNIGVNNFPATQAVTQSGAWTTGRTWSLLNSTDSVNSVQSGSWTTGRTWSLLNTTDSVNVGNFPSSFGVTQNTSPWVISGTVTANIGTTNGLALDSSVTALSAKFNSLGQKTMANSAPVVLSSDQSAIPVTQSGSWSTGRTWSLLNTTDSVNVGNFPATFGVTQSTSPWVISGTVTANAGTNLNTSALALDSTVAKDASLTTINTSVNTLLKPASTLAAVTTLGTITNALPTGTNSIGQVTANAGTNLNTSALALSATQTDGTQKTKMVDGSNATVGPVTTLSAVNYLPVVTASSATSGSAVPARSILVAGSDGTNARNLSTDTSGNLNVVVTSTAAASRTSVNLARNVYSTTNVTTAAYVQLIASTSDTTNQLFVFDSSGQTLVLATGAAASEVDKYYIVPGGNGLINLTIASGTRVSVKAVSATANSGELSITFIK